MTRLCFLDAIPLVWSNTLQGALKETPKDVGRMARENREDVMWLVFSMTVKGFPLRDIFNEDIGRTIEGSTARETRRVDLATIVHRANAIVNDKLMVLTEKEKTVLLRFCILAE